MSCMFIRAALLERRGDAWDAELGDENDPVELGSKWRAIGEAIDEARAVLVPAHSGEIVHCGLGRGSHSSQ